jgi:DNA-binding transcriptional MerR regulator
MDELVERVREALAAEYSGAGDGRIRDVPDRRAIRWYTTIGLVDRPLGMRGRSALYGPRHLQQLVAIKRRQAAGRSLSQIQGELNWVSAEALAELSRVPEQLLEADGPQPEGLAEGRHMRFWAQQPMAHEAADSTEYSPAMHSRAGYKAARHTPAENDPAEPNPAEGNPAEHSPAQSDPAERDPAKRNPSGHSPAQFDPAERNTAAHNPAGRSTAEHGTAEQGTAEQGTAEFEPAGHKLAGPGLAERPSVRAVNGLALRGGAILLVPHAISEADRDAIAEAAAPLLDLLDARGLLDGRSA